LENNQDKKKQRSKKQDNMDDLYQEHILDHANAPRNFGHLQHPTETGAAKNVSCGDSLTLELQTDAQGIIQEIAWQGDGCAISMAAASLLSEQAVGKNLAELQHLSLPDVLSALGLGSVSPARIKCATLFLNALHAVERQNDGKQSRSVEQAE
jgi:nitrogen fixation NifU-like protein